MDDGAGTGRALLTRVAKGRQGDSLDRGLEIAPEATATLAPGSYHIMMMGLKEPLKQGTRVPLTLQFEKAGKVDIELAVTAMGATPDMKDMKH